MEETNIKSSRSGKAILIGVTIFLLLPMLLSFIVRPKATTLHGAFYVAPDADFTFHWWFSRQFQDQKEKFLRHAFPFHDEIVRINNQLDYDLFKKARVRYVVPGKNEFLFEEAYINAYYGKDFVGEEKINDW